MNEATRQTGVFDSIANDLRIKGFSIQKNALPHTFTADLLHCFKVIPPGQLKQAGVGRAQGKQSNSDIRRDEIAWIESAANVLNTDNPNCPSQQWLNFAAQLQQHLNRTLMLGLFSFESHFAHYAPGAFYKTHVDAFKGQANRVLSVVLYLNPDWGNQDGGEMMLYGENADDDVLATVRPEAGTLAVFLSEDFPHEVLPANRDRYSIAGWYRVNTSSTSRVDPPF